MTQVAVGDDDSTDRGWSPTFVKHEGGKAGHSLQASQGLQACLGNGMKMDQVPKSGGAATAVETVKPAPAAPYCNGGESGPAVTDSPARVPGMSATTTTTNSSGGGSTTPHKATRPPLIPSANRPYVLRSGPNSPSERAAESAAGATQSRNLQACPFLAAPGDAVPARLAAEWKHEAVSNVSGVYLELEQLRSQYVRVCSENELLRQQLRNMQTGNVLDPDDEEVVRVYQHRERQQTGEAAESCCSPFRQSPAKSGMRGSPCLSHREVEAGALPDAELISYLQRSQRLLDLALKYVPLIVSHCDLDLRYTYVRFVHCPSIEICPREILGKRDSELLGLIPGAKEMADLKQEALRSGVPQTKELMVGDGNETQKCLVLICEPTVNAAGATTGLTTLCMDVTYQVTVKDRLAQMGQEVASHEATEKELRVVLARADEAMEAKNNFLAVMSHEIRTPLNGVLGMAQVLATTKLDSEQKELVDAMVFSGDVLMAIISDILDLSKVESGTMDLEERELNPRDIVKHVVRTTIAVTKDRGLRILADVCPDIPPLVIGDPLRIKQVITNLVFNAVKFTKKGHVVVRLRLAKSNGEPSGEVDVKLSSQEATARVMQLDPTTEHPAPVVQDVDLGGEIYDLEPTSKLDATWDPLLEGGRRGISHAEDEDIISLEHAVAEQDRRIVVSTGVAAMLGSNIAKELDILDQPVAGSTFVDNPDEKPIWLQCEVEDTGIGIPKKSFPTLFQKFMQVHSSTTRKYGGTGLGLAICKRLVELMGGKIYVASEVGVGSKFTFTIRCKRPASASGASRAVSVSETMLKTNLSHTAARVHKLRAGMLVPPPCEGIPQRAPLVEIFPGDLKTLLPASSPPGHKGGSIHERPGSWGGHEVPFALSPQPIPAAARTADNSGKLGETKSNGLRRTSSGPPRIECSLLAAIEESKEVQVKTCTTSGEKRILLAEDNKVNVMVAQSMLKRLGLVADVAYNGLEAVKAIKRSHYDLVLMDICMPVMDGLEVTRRVRQFERTGYWDEDIPTTPDATVHNAAKDGLADVPTGADAGDTCGIPKKMQLFKRKRLPIVAMTANALLDCENKCSANGMDSFMTKPVTFKKLKDVLDSFLVTKSTSMPAAIGSTS